jgi:hypothetical protein
VESPPRTSTPWGNALAFALAAASVHAARTGFRCWLLPERLQQDAPGSDRTGGGTAERWSPIGLRLPSRRFCHHAGTVILVHRRRPTTLDCHRPAELRDPDGRQGWSAP